jgi:4-amino-4-deoxy-L-arabinose transferase-like glycosyltransferase
MAEDELATYRFLACWIAVYFIAFTAASTKLPNYILPLYPAVAILTARFLDRWRLRDLQPPAWLLPLSLMLLIVLGAGLAGGLILASGMIPVSWFRARQIPDLIWCSPLGLVPAAGAILAWWHLRRDRRNGLITSMAATAFVLVGALAAWGTLAVDRHKAPRPLAQIMEQHHSESEFRVGCYAYYQPSLVFYCRQEVRRLEDEDGALEFLQCPLPVYLFVPAEVWSQLEAKVDVPYRLLGRHYDLYRGCEVVLVTNRGEW